VRIGCAQSEFAENRFVSEPRDEITSFRPTRSNRISFLFSVPSVSSVLKAFQARNVRFRERQRSQWADGNKPWVGVRGMWALLISQALVWMEKDPEAPAGDRLADSAW